MQKVDFIVGSIAFHAALFVLVLLLPPPFSTKRVSDSGLTYVELTHPARAAHKRARRAPPTQPGEFMAYSRLPEGFVKGGYKTTRANAGGDEASGPEAHARPSTPFPPQKRSSTTSANQPPSLKAPPLPPSADRPAEKPNVPEVALTEDAHDTRAVEADRASINFKLQKGWPAPGMVRLKVGQAGKGKDAPMNWRATADEDWIIVSPNTGRSPGVVRVGVDTSKMSLGYYEGTLKIAPLDAGVKGCEVTVSVMALPKDAGRPELPHYSYDPYMDNNCKACHLPKEVMPSADYMMTPDFCALCHNPNGMAAASVAGKGGHPVMVEAGKGGTKRPTYGRTPTGPKSDRMDTHLKDGALVVCVTCHNVMEKPRDYGRTYELAEQASKGDRRTYRLYRGGWENMGYLKPKVYVTDGLIKMPKYLKEAQAYMVEPGQYEYDESEGEVTFKGPLPRDGFVYVTLSNPYLRVTTENNAMCYDCHHENTHQGLGCLSCHQMHGTSNIRCVRQVVRTGDGAARRVVFKARQGKGSFADGSGGGICEVCHAGAHSRHKDGKDYAGTDCTKCHTHKNGFGV